MTPTRHAPKSSSLPPEARDALVLGKMVEAVKILHEQRAMSLLEAKTLIEAQVKSDPQLARALQDAREHGLRGLKIAAMAIGGIVLLVYFYLTILRPHP